VIGAGRWGGGLGRLAFRNAFRQPGRLLLIVGLLAAAGSTFLTAFNLPRAFDARLVEMTAGRKYALAVRLPSTTPAAAALGIVGAVPGVAGTDGFRVATATWGEAGDLAIVHTYPDQGHGRFQVIGVPPRATLIDFPLVAGRWLSGAEDEGVVLNHLARAAVPAVAVGDLVTFSAEGQTHRRRVVGFVRDLGSPATAYVAASAFADWSPETNAINLVYVGLGASAGSSPSTGASTAAAIDAALTARGVKVAQVVATETLRNAVTEHMVVLIGLLLALAALMTVVATLGLAAAMGTAVVERTREIGVMAALGATPGAIVRIIAGEGVVVGALGGVAGVLLAVPVSAGVGALVGSLAFRVSLPVVLSPIGVMAWLALVGVLAVLASGAPARRAGRLGVADALART